MDVGDEIRGWRAVELGTEYEREKVGGWVLDGGGEGLDLRRREISSLPVGMGTT